MPEASLSDRVSIDAFHQVHVPQHATDGMLTDMGARRLRSQMHTGAENLRARLRRDTFVDLERAVGVI
jgi:hypothetical protein